MPTNYTLKLVLLQSPWTQKVIAEMIGLTSARLSKIVGGYTHPTVTEKEGLSKVLGKSVEALFGKKSSG